ncbi:hypothetical protein GQ53DRAFT_780856 [Thozetella sp. PMI_491]|nr:hypothetical protein GQ53DRAFT_780856 [Thozetella sp. PMI_491]
MTFPNLSRSVELPANCDITRISPYGESSWECTAKIETRDSSGNDVPYFLKVHVGDQFRDLVMGEYHAIIAIHQAMPSLAPRPVACGNYISQPNAWFFLSEFRSLGEELPDVEEFAERIAELHTRGINRDAAFGWPYSVLAGGHPRTYPASESWEETFKSGLEQTFDLEEKIQGSDEEWVALRAALMEKVVPRLLKPLQMGGRSITPTIMHGDIWHGNAAVDTKTGTLVIFDPMPMYGHNEFGFLIGIEYVKEYIKHRPPSEPQEDFDDRLRLYAM